MSHTFEVVPREQHQHRPGHMALLIDGLDADVTCDPAQFMPKALRQALTQSNTGPAATIKADALCQAWAREALERKAERLKLGRIGQGVSAVPTSALASTRKATEDKAVEQYLNRGKLKGLSKEQREELAKRRVERQHDHTAEWLERRAAKVAGVQAAIKHWEAELANQHPKAEKRLRNLRAELAALTSPVVAVTHGFQYAYSRYLTKQVDFVADDIRFVLCMTNTDADTLRDAVDACSDLALDEFDGSGYSSGGIALGSQAVNVDDANDRAEIDAADPTPVAYGSGTREIEGILVISFITNLSASLPAHFLDFAPNKDPDGSDFSIVINAEGFIQASG